MKCLNFWLVCFCYVITSSVFAQTPQQIEADLLKSFKKIGYWDEKQNDTTIGMNVRFSSLEKANTGFAKKLKYYAEKFPATIVYPFSLLKKGYLIISTSSDGLFRTYSWDTETGGTMHFFDNVIQYKSGDKTKVVVDTPHSAGDVRPGYYKIYTFTAGGKAYYLTNYLYIESSRYSSYGITVFAIENGEIVESKIIKTQSGMHSDLSYECDFSLIDEKAFNNLPEIHFDNASNTIYLPLVDGKEKMTKKFILYKFTGQYFEKIKN